MARCDGMGGHFVELESSGSADGLTGTVLQISQQSRAPSELSMDGREVCILQPGDYVKIKQSEYPIPCLGREAKSDDWVADIKWVTTMANA